MLCMVDVLLFMLDEGMGWMTRERKKEEIFDDEILPTELEKKRQIALTFLGDRWLLHKAHAPKKALYNQWGKPVENLGEKL